MSAAHLGAASRPGAFASILAETVESLGPAWSEWAPLPGAWFESEEAEAYARRLGIALSETFAGEGLFVVEDVRIARLAPLWRRAMALAGFEPCFILVAGDPGEAIAAEVAAGRSKTAAALAWLRATLDAERGARASRRLILADPAVCEDWRRAMARTAAAFGFAWPAWSNSVEAEVDQAFGKAAPTKMQAVSPDPEDNVARWCDRAFAALGALALQPDAAKPAERLDETLARADRLAAQIAPLVREEVAAVERAHAEIDRRNQKRIGVYRIQAYEAAAALNAARVTSPSPDRPSPYTPTPPEPAPVQEQTPAETFSDEMGGNHRTAELQAEVDALRGAQMDAGALLTARDRDIEDLKRALAAERGAADALEDLEARHAEAKAALARAEADAGRWRGAAHRLAEEVGAKVAAALDAAARREAEASSALAAALADAHALTVERASLSGRVAGLEAALEMRRTAAARAAEQADAAAEAMREQLSVAGREIETLRAEAEAREATLRAWRDQGFWRRLVGAGPKAPRK
ncbi:hypothetical protein [Phenylobacterium immobile]|uniref:hypothetical protein n=1 Tax=Phenylobacterium immobile TaxID=21 RepID=UPI000A6B35B8|nr:hypothetical protein [Phenylobacterium immobile]